MSLYKRLIPENKAAIKEYGERYPHTASMIIAELKSEEFYTNVRYGTAYDVERICNIDFLGDAFLDR
tara:strand:+ start:96 stop:296 length:201 start_codon:yes stop_codon:yes gene_type:complete